MRKTDFSTLIELPLLPVFVQDGNSLNEGFLLYRPAALRNSLTRCTRGLGEKRLWILQKFSVLCH